MRVLITIIIMLTTTIGYAKPPPGTFNFRHFQNVRVYEKVYRDEALDSARYQHDGYKYSNDKPRKWNGYGFYRPTVYTSSGSKWNGYGHP